MSGSCFLSKLFSRSNKVGDDYDYFRAKLASAESLAPPHRRAFSSTVETNRISTVKSSSSFKEPTQVNQYCILSDLGCGSYGAVKRCKNIENGKFYALKIISKSWLKKKHRVQSFQSRSRLVLNKGEESKDGMELSRSRRRSHEPSSETTSSSSQSIEDDALYEIRKEIAILKKVSNHPCIVSLIEVLDDQQENYLYLGINLLSSSF